VWHCCDVGKHHCALSTESTSTKLKVLWLACNLRVLAGFSAQNIAVPLSLFDTLLCHVVDMNQSRPFKLIR
jgi:hypothetical protein